MMASSMAQVWPTMPVTIWCPRCSLACGLSLFFDGELDFEDHKRSTLHITRTMPIATGSASRLLDFKMHLAKEEIRQEIYAQDATGTQFSWIIERRFESFIL